MKWKVLSYCLLGGLPLTIAALDTGGFGWWWLSGLVLAAGFVPVAIFGPRRPIVQFTMVLSALWMVTVLCTWSEAVVFMPGFSQHPVRDLVGSAISYLVIAAVLAGLAWALKLTRPQGPKVERRSVWLAPLMVLLGGFAYAFYYLVFGGITYQYFTKSYYPQATQLVAQLGPWFWPLEIGRGVLMTLGVLPVIYTLRMPRWQSAIAVGALVWIAGGLSPLLLPAVSMGTTQRIIHIVEIFTQNASLGITAVLLLRPKPSKTSTQLAAAA